MSTTAEPHTIPLEMHHIIGVQAYKTSTCILMDSIKGAPTIALDIDGVLANLMNSVINHINKVYYKHLDMPLKVGDITEWNVKILQNYKVGDFIRILQQTPGFIESLEPYPHAARVVTGLLQYFNVVLITDRPHNTHYHTQKWLFNYDIFYHSLYTTEGQYKKYEVLLRCQKCVLVDDKTQNLHDFLENTDGIAFMPLMPWNVKLLDEFHSYSLQGRFFYFNHLPEMFRKILDLRKLGRI